MSCAIQIVQYGNKVKNYAHLDKFCVSSMQDFAAVKCYTKLQKRFS